MKHTFTKLILEMHLKTKLLILTLLILNVFKAQSQTNQYEWKSVAMGGGGFVSGIITSKQEANLIYARTDVGGAYRWDATNERWIALTDWVSEDQAGFLGVESMAIDPQAPSKLYMLVGISYFNGGK